MTFTYHGDTHAYYDHPYNTTRRNERAVELPVAFDWLDQRTGRGLEIGNVTSHYRTPSHRIIDLTEHAPGVDNIDLFDLSGEQFDWILSISTLEHVRWDFGPREPGGAIRAFGHLLGLLASGGRMLVTVPFGSHPHLDTWILSGGPRAVREASMVRAGDGWVQTQRLEWRPYGVSTIWAESVWIGEW